MPGHGDGQGDVLDGECPPALALPSSFASPGLFAVCPQISAESVALWINTVVGASTLFGLWALGILFRQARLHLTEQNIKAKFFCFQVSTCPAQLLPR